MLLRLLAPGRLVLSLQTTKELKPSRIPVFTNLLLKLILYINAYIHLTNAHRSTAVREFLGVTGTRRIRLPMPYCPASAQFEDAAQLEPQMLGFHPSVPFLAYYRGLWQSAGVNTKTNQKNQYISSLAKRISNSQIKQYHDNREVLPNSPCTDSHLLLRHQLVLPPILSPSMDGLNHLREQSTHAIVDKILEEMYSLLVVQIQPEFLLELIDDAPHKQRACHFEFLNAPCGAHMLLSS